MFMCSEIPRIFDKTGKHRGYVGKILFLAFFQSMFQCNFCSSWHERWPHCTLFLSVPPPLWLPLFFFFISNIDNKFQAFIFNTGLFVFHFPFHAPSYPQPSGMWPSMSTSLILSPLYPTASVASLASYICSLLDLILQSCQITPLGSHPVIPWI